MSTPTQDNFELTLARPVVLPAGHHPTLVHLWWRCTQQDDRLVQVYVNDELYDVTAEPTHRQMWLVLDRTQSQRIELLAVPVDQALTSAWTVQSSKLRAWQPRVNDVAELVVLRDETLPVDARLAVSVDGDEMDSGALWPSETHRGGFGALFGEGAFGADAATGSGLGRGELGYGPLGADGTAWRWRRPDLAEGDHTLAIIGESGDGQAVTDALETSVTIERLPEPAAQIEIDSAFTLQWQ